MVSDLTRPTPLQQRLAQNGVGQQAGLTPSNSVAQFQNQRPVFAGRPGTQSTSFMPGDRVGGPARISPVEVSAVGRSARRTTDTVKASAERMTSIFKANQRAAQKRTGDQTLGAQFGNMKNAGQAWQTDGSLSASRNALLQDASSYIGSRYVLGGRTYKGIDCSGLIMNVYNKLGFDIGVHHADWQRRNIPGVRTSVNNLRPGDIVAWKDGSHIAIYAGNGQIIEAANPKTGTVRRRLWANPNDVIGIAVRLPGE